MFLDILLVLGLSASNDGRDSVDNEVVYEVQPTSIPTSNNAYAFREDKAMIAGYIRGGESGDSLNPKIWHSYTKSRDGDLVRLSFNNLTVPVGVSAGRKWSTGMYTCSASARRRDNDRELLVVCYNRGGSAKIDGAYAYEPKKGITGFFAPCLGQLTCWYELKSEQGILHDLAE